jgi:hypothetical protein
VYRVREMYISQTLIYSEEEWDMATEDIMDSPQAFTPATNNGNGQVPAQALVEQTLLRINGHISLSPAQYMALSGNACKLNDYLSSAEGVVIPFQQDKLPFGVGLRDLRTVLRALKELYQHDCIRVQFDQIVLDHPMDLHVAGRKVVLKTESEFITINRIYVRCVPFPDQIPPLVARALDEKLQRQIVATEERLIELKRAKDQWERIRRQQKPGDTTKSAASLEVVTGNGQGSEEALHDGERR